MNWIDITYNRKSLFIKLIGSLLLIVMTVVAYFISGLTKTEGIIYSIWIGFLVIALIFSTATFLNFLFHTIMPKKRILFSFNEKGIKYKNNIIPYDEIEDMSYGLDVSHIATAFWQGVIINKKNEEKFIIPTYQVLTDKEVDTLIFEPIDKARLP